MQLINSEVRIENTNKCNANCSICPRDKLTRKLATMELEKFKDLVLQAKSLGANTISIFGYGEPLLDKTIVQKVKFCTRNGLETFITTNASLLNMPTSIRLLDAGLTHIRFSVHGLQDTYALVHGLDAKVTLTNIDKFLILNAFDHSNKCKTSVSVIPQHGETVEEIREYWECEYGIDGVAIDWLEIWKPHNWTDGKKFRDIKRVKKTCGRPQYGPVQINADGKVMVCCFDFDAKLTVGDTHTNTIEEILKGKEFSEIRRKHADGDLKGLICETCDQLNENDDPLLYSSRDPEKQIGITSSTKFKIGE